MSAKKIDPKKVKRVIKRVAKTTGKYTLKGLAKGTELVGRGAVRGIDAMVNNPVLQKISTGIGVLAVSTMVPAVGAGLIGVLALKTVYDKYLLGKNKSILSEIDDIMRPGNRITKDVASYILSPTLKSLDKGIGKMGKDWQTKINGMGWFK